jgi:hypothetical protein
MYHYGHFFAQVVAVLNQCLPDMSADLPAANKHVEAAVLEPRMMAGKTNAVVVTADLRMLGFAWEV